jgi:hypothetical protein
MSEAVDLNKVNILCDDQARSVNVNLVSRSNMANKRSAPRDELFLRRSFRFELSVM